MAKVNEYLTAQELGDRLGVTAARVRQLVEEKKLPEPTAFGVRANLWHHSALEVFKSASRGEGRITGQAALLEPASAPLHRDRDVLHYFAPRPGATPWIVHVRIFSGDVSEGIRTVVVLSRLNEHQYADVQIERIVESIDDHYLGGRGVEATWVEVYSQEMRRAEHSASNLILTETRSLSRRNRRERLFGSKARYCDPIWAPLRLADLDSLIGAPLEWWPPEAYSKDNVQRWQRLRREIVVDHDPAGLVRGFEALEALKAEETTTALSRLAASEIARQLLVKAEDLEALGPGGGIDGSEDAIEWPGTWAARLRLVTLDAEQSKSLKKQLVDPGDVAELAALLDRLRDWNDQLLLSGGSHTRPLQDAVALAIEDCQHHLHQHGTEGWLAAQPKRVVRTFAVGNDNDKRYLQAVTWDTSPLETMAVRELRRQFSELPETGADRSGHDVALSLDGTQYAVQWPVFPDTSVEVADDAYVVTGGGWGDQPAFIEQSGAMIGVIAIDPDDLYSQRSIGRGGAGPIVLAGDIARHFRVLDGAQPSKAWLLDQVENAEEFGLRLSVRELRKRAGRES